MAKRFVRFLLCRHTQTDLNAQKRYSGAREDVPLNAVGEAQAEALAEKVALLPIVAIHASDLLRTRQVATRIATYNHLAVLHDARLREVDIGAIGTLQKTEAQERFPEEWHRTSGPDYDFRDIGGESRSQVVERHVACFQEMLGRYGGTAPEDAPLVVVVGHGTALRTMLEHLGAPDAKLHEQGDYQIVLYSD